MHQPSIALYLPRYSTYGGVERFAYNLANFLTDQQFKVFFICARQEIPNHNQRLTIIRTGRPLLPKFGKMAWYILKSEQIKKKIKADIHFSLGKNLSNDLLRIGGGPLKTFWQLSQKAYLGFEQKLKMFKRKTSPANWLTFYLERSQLQKAKKIICVSHLVKKWLKQSYPFLEENKLEVVYNLPDLKKFYPRPKQKYNLREKFKLPLKNKLILTVATNFKLKGISFLIHSLQYLPSNYTLVIAGNRNPYLYQRLARQLQLDSRVIFLGKVMEIEKLYSACDFFVLNSFYDACSNALLEAMASGLISISSQFNGSSCFLPPSNIINDPTDPKQIAQIIKTAQYIPLNFPKDYKFGFQPYLEIINQLL